MTSPARRPAPIHSARAAGARCARAACPATRPRRSLPRLGRGAACPYAAAAIIGQRAECVLRFPEAVAVDAAGRRVRRRPAELRRAEVQRGRRSTSASGAPTAAGTASSGRSAGSRPTPRATCTSSTRATTGSRSSTPNGDFITAWGHKGSELGDFNFGSSQNYTQPPGGGIAVAGEYVYVADSGNNRIERFNLNGGEPIEWGSKGSGPGPVLLPARRRRQRNRGAGRRRRQPPHREVHPERRLRGARSAPTAPAPGSSASPTASRWTRPGTCTSPTTSTTASSSSTPSSGSPAHGAASARDPASSRSRARWPATRRATPTSPTPPTTASRCSTPSGDYLRTIGTSARDVAGAFVAPRGLAVDPTGRLSCPTPTTTASSRSPRAAAPSRLLDGRRRLQARLRRTAGIAFDPRGSVYVADTGNARVARLWGEGTYLSELGGPADLGGAGLSGAGSVAVVAARASVYVADTNHNRVLIYSPTGTLLAKVGRRRRRRRAGQRIRASSTTRRPVAVAPVGRRVRGRHRQQPHRRALRRAGPMSAQFGGLRLGRRAACTTRPASRSTPPGACMWSTPTNNRVEVFDRIGPLPRQVGPARRRPGRILPADRDRGRLRRQRVRGRHEQQPRRALRPGHARRGGLPGRRAPGRRR